MEFCKKRNNKYINITPQNLFIIKEKNPWNRHYITEEGITQLEIPINLKRQLMGEGSLQHDIPDLIETPDEQPEEEIQKSK